MDCIKASPNRALVSSPIEIIVAAALKQNAHAEHLATQLLTQSLAEHRRRIVIVLSVAFREQDGRLPMWLVVQLENIATMDSDVDMRYLAVMNLGSEGRYSARLRALFASIAAGSDNVLAAQAIASLGRSGQLEAIHIELLQDLSKSSDPQVSAMASDVLRRNGVVQP